MLLLTVNWESLAVRRSTFVPGALKLAVVPARLALLNVTVPGPDTLLHEICNSLPGGRPSSMARPTSVATAGKRIVWFSPASTIGGAFVGCTLMVTPVEVLVAPLLSVALAART